jgi:hypothetical protein
MKTVVKTPPSRGQAKALSLEQQVNQKLAIVWKDLALEHFRSVFAQERTCRRFVDVTSGMLFAVARRKTVTASIVARGNEDKPTWDADYWLFREAVWNPEDMFRAVFDAAVPLIPEEGPIVIAIDDTALPKVGCKPSKTSSREGAPGLAGWCHNPLAPPWQHPALHWAHKMFHAVLVIPTRLNGRATGITLAFEPIPDPVGDLRLVARNAEFPSKSPEFWVGGEERKLKVKELGPLYRRTSTRKKLMRVFILVPQAYGPADKRERSQEAFLLTSDLTTPKEVLIQAYLDRWTIENVHRDMKFHVGVGQAQVSTTHSVRRTHAAIAAAWALLQIAALMVCGEERTEEHFGKLTAWQRRHRDWRTRKRLAEGKTAPVFRPTAPDILSLFRKGHGVLWTNRQVPFRI